ncbi:MAG: HAD-IIA family hydrolase [Deltaproteobacteria bacterium]|nr:HAD-IIA family hydrolase [Deltaproteobacteria bacterium]MBW2137642.1 HAD-IIA family hydrolase [Deltaproteobacteria bacterium]
MAEKIKGVIFDINGVLEFQGKPYPGAPELLEQLRGQGIGVCILTNTTLRSRKECAAKLNNMGFSIRDEEIITAAYATARYLEDLKPRSCWIMVQGSGLEEFGDFPQDVDDPEVIVVGDYREGFNFSNLNRALELLMGGAKLIVMIPEKVDRSMGQVELTVGAYGKMLEDAAGVKATYIGKPSPHIYEMALRKMGLEKGEVLMVGDRVGTDILGAKRAGIRSVLVKTGEFQPGDLQGKIRPNHTIESIRELGRLLL